MNRRRTGGCLCGAVRYELESDETEVVLCHCSMCRRQGGHAQASFNVPRERLRWTLADGLAWYRSSAAARRPFCKSCGSALGFEEDEGTVVSLNAGSLDDGGEGLHMAGHIFVASKGAYYTVDDGLPQYDRGRPEDTDS